MLRVVSALLIVWLVSLPSQVRSAESAELLGIRAKVELGLGGVWKVGYPTRAAITVSSGSKPVRGRVELQTYDGDGVAVAYGSAAWQIDIEANSSASIEAIVKSGRANRPIDIRILGKDETVLLQRPLEPEERGTSIPATQPWIVGIGNDSLKLDQAAMKSARGALAEYTTTAITRVEQLPVTSTCLEGIDLLVYSSSNSEFNKSLDPSRATAIRDWIGHGGRSILSMGSNAQSWMSNATIAQLVPGTLKDISAGCEPGPLESYLGSQSQLANLNCAVFAFDSGTTEISTQTTNRTKFPLIARWAYGSGKILFIATEIDGPEIIGWESRPSLLKTLFEEQWERKDPQTEKLAYQGYDDLSGQLNATLDYFPGLTLGNLTSISLIAALLCFVIGPLDYFLISKTWKKPRGTWITLLVCSIGSCAIAASLANAWKPTTPSINSLEIIDIDLSTQSLMGRGFARCYGGQRGEFDFSAHRKNQGLNANAGSAAATVQLDWFGQPGRGLGGFDSSVATDRGMPVYRIRIGPNENSVAESTLATSENGVSQHGIDRVGIPFAGTKAISTQWTEPVSVSNSIHTLSMVPGSIDLLEGTFTNSLDADLLDGILIYRGRAYTLPTRFRMGETLSFAATTVPKDITRRLQRRQNFAGEERSSPWDPADTSSLGRLVELVSFHKAASGSNYTSLYNRYLGSLDCSDVVRQDRAMLFAEVKDASLTWSIRRNGVPIQASEGQRRTFVRLLIPISKSTKNSSTPTRPATQAGQP